MYNNIHVRVRSTNDNLFALIKLRSRGKCLMEKNFGRTIRTGYFLKAYKFNHKKKKKILKNTWKKSSVFRSALDTVGNSIVDRRAIENRPTKLHVRREKNDPKSNPSYRVYYTGHERVATAFGRSSSVRIGIFLETCIIRKKTNQRRSSGSSTGCLVGD